MLKAMASVNQFWFATIEEFLWELVSVSLVESLLHQVNTSSLVDTVYHNSKVLCEENTNICLLWAVFAHSVVTHTACTLSQLPWLTSS